MFFEDAIHLNTCFNISILLQSDNKIHFVPNIRNNRDSINTMLARWLFNRMDCLQSVVVVVD